MKVLKWILIATACLTVLLIAVGIGGYLYVFRGPSLELTAADMEVGSPWPPTERAALVSACLKKSNSEHRERASTFCECVAKETETKTSRAARLMIAADFDDDWRQMARVVLATGIVAFKTDASSIGEGRDVAESLQRNCGKRR
jgi:uncharacterized membrane protein